MRSFRQRISWAIVRNQCRGVKGNNKGAPAWRFNRFLRCRSSSLLPIPTALSESFQSTSGPSVSHQLEIVLVVPSAQGANINRAELDTFCGIHIVEIGDMTSTARARAAGVQRAAAPVVAFVEDNSFPAKGWAEALIQAHRQPWAAVGPMMANANPPSLVSWANLIIEYAEWMEPVPAGVAEHLPGHNGTNKRALLLEYGDRLEAMLEAESILRWDLRAKGHPTFGTAAKTDHQDFQRPFRGFHCV